MKTLIITLEYPPQVGGIASYIYNLALHLDPDQTVVYAPKMKDSKEFDVLNKWKTYRLNPYFSFIWPRWIRMYLQISSLVKAEKIEQIYVNHVLPVGYVAYLIKKFKKIPFTIFLHGTDISMAMVNKSKRNKFIKLCRSANTIVVNSDFLKNKVMSVVDGLTDIRVLYPCPADNFLLDDVNKDELSILRSKLALGGKKVMITVARMVEGKGYPHLIHMLPEILKQIPNAVWLVVGDGPKYKEILTMVQKNSLQNVVRFVGNIQASEIRKYYRLADLFVLLTHKDEHREEGWGTVFLEAAACGLPVVAGQVGGVEEAVLNGQTGLLVDIHQEQATVGAIVSLLKDAKLAQQYGQAGKERVVNYFKWENEVLKLQ